MDIPANEPLYITSKEVCERWGCSLTKLWRMERDTEKYPDFPACYDFTRNKQWDRSAMVEFMEKHTNPNRNRVKA